jgi:hypothetical protein
VWHDRWSDDREARTKRRLVIEFEPGSRPRALSALATRSQRIIH